MELSKHAIFGSIGTLTVAALAMASLPQDGSAPGSLDGLLRPSPGGVDEEPGPARSGAVPLARPKDLDDPFLLEESYRSRLLSDDLDLREKAFDEIAREAATGGAAQAALEAISQDLADPDLAFTARLALREARRDRGSSLQTFASPWSRGGFNGVHPMEALQQRMQEMIDNDPFVRDFMSSDPFSQDPFFRMGPSSPFRKRPSLFGNGGSGDPFQELEERIQAWRDEMNGGRARGGGSQALPAPSPNASQRMSTRSSSMSMESTPDGVRVEITEDDGSGPSTKVYEAPSIKLLLEAHPELKGRIR